MIWDGRGGITAQLPIIRKSVCFPSGAAFAAELLVLVYCKTGLFHYMEIREIFPMTKLIVRSTDKYITDAHGQSVCRIILYKSPRMVCFRETDSPFVYHFCFF